MSHVRLISLVLCLAGCNEAAGPAACTTHPAAGCGGDLVGTWKLSCHDTLGSGIQVTPMPELTYVFGADGTYKRSSSNGDYVVQIANADFQPDGGVHSSDCAELDKSAGLFAGHCVPAGDNCDCTYAASGLTETGTYSTTDVRVMLQGPIATFFEGYCVSGNTLSLEARAGNFLTSGTYVKQP